MAIFTYKAYDQSGAKVDGQLEANDKAAAIAQLKQLALLPTEVKDFTEAQKSVFGFSSKVSLSDLEFLTAELSLLLESGVRIDRGIDIIKRTKAKPALAKLLTDISNELKKGNSLSGAVKEHSDVFDPLYCNLIELGEASGNLSEVFAGLAIDLKFRRDLQRKIISSLAYPMVIFFVCILSVFFIFNFIIPKMSAMFEGVDNLPWYTDVMLSTSEWMIQYQGLLLIGVIASIFGLIYGTKQPAFIKWWQGVSLKQVRKRSIELSELFIQEISKHTDELMLASPIDPQLRGSQVSFRFDQGYALVQALIAQGVVGDFRMPNIVRFGITPLYLGEADIVNACEKIVLVLEQRLWDQPQFKVRSAVT